MNLDELEWLRRQFIAALASDDVLRECLVLKGGNALSLIHGIGFRASTDIDYSIEAQLSDPEGFGGRAERALRERLAANGFVLFDWRFERRPAKGSGDRKWGGHTATFKVIDKAAFDARESLEQARRESIPVLPNPQAQRRFRIEISNYEYCAEKVRESVDGEADCYVYTREMIAAEKLRSLCQQMDEYGKRANPTRRARDFYDLHALVTEGGVELSEERMHDLVQIVFETKQVPVRLLALLNDYGEYHRTDWPAVRNAIPSDRPDDFDFYLGFIVEETRKLEPLWIENAP